MTANPEPAVGSHQGPVFTRVCPRCKAPCEVTLEYCPACSWQFLSVDMGSSPSRRYWAGDCILVAGQTACTVLAVFILLGGSVNYRMGNLLMVPILLAGAVLFGRAVRRSPDS